MEYFKALFLAQKSKKNAKTKPSLAQLNSKQSIKIAPFSTH
jgi:hypothetical protein